MLVTLKTFEFLHEAELLKATLENEGITCALFDAQTVGLNPLYSNAIGGIKLKVKTSDQQRAMEFITSLDQSQKERKGSTCPKCGGSNVGLRDSDGGLKGIFTLIQAFLFTILPFRQRSSFSCKDCGTYFQREKDS